MPVYTIKNKRTGKSYDMPWDGPEPPTQVDMATFSDKQEGMGLTKGEAFNRWRQTPLADKLPDSLNPAKLSEKYLKPITEEGMAHPEGVMGKVRKYGGGFAESIADMASQATRPDEAAILAATMGSGSVARAGWTKLGTAMGLPGRVMAGKMGLQGAGEAYEGAKEGDWTSVGTGLAHAGLGAAGAYYNPASRGALPKAAASEEMGLQSISPKATPPPRPPTAPEPPGTGMMRKPLPKVTSEPIYDAEVSPPPQKALPPARSSDVTYGPEPPTSITPKGLPAPRRTFYGGPAGGSLSTDINEVPTRTFAGGEGNAPPGRMPARSFSQAMGKLRPTKPLEDATPSGASWRDILEQNSPYGRILRGEDFLNEQPARVSPPAAPVGTGSVVEPVMGPVTPTAPVVKPAVKPAPIAKTPPSIPDIEEPPTGLGSLAEWLGKKVRDQRGAVKIGGGGLGPADEMSVPGPQQAKVLKFGSAKLDAEKALEAKRSAAMNDMEEMLKEQERDSQKLSDIRDSMRARRDPKMVAYEDAGNPLDSVSDATIKKRWAEQLHPNWSQAQVDKYSNGMMRYLRADLHDAGYTPPTGVKPTLVPTETKGQIGGSKIPDIAEDVSSKPKIGNLGKNLKTRETAARKLMKLFGSPTDEQIAERTQKLKEGSYITPDELKDTGIQSGLEAPAQKMPLRQRLGKLETKITKKLGNIEDQTGAVQLGGGGLKEGGAISSLKKAFTSNVPKLTKEARQLQEDNHFNAKDWSTRRAAATQHGIFEGQDFADLKAGGLDLLKKFRAGDRTGRLADVQKWADKLFNEEQAAGLNTSTKTKFMEAITKPKFVGKGGISLPSSMKTPETYMEGSQLGLSPKFDNLADMIADRTRRSKVAIANKRFDSYLEQSGQKLPNSFDKSGKPIYGSVNNPQSLRLTGAEAETIGDLIDNVHMKPNKYWKASGMLAGKSKNLTLTGGIPGTPLNMHGGSIGRSMFQVMGKEGVENWTKGVLDPDYLVEEGKRLRPLVREAIDHGYQHTAGEAEGLDAFHQWLEKYPVGRYVSKGMQLQEKWFEDPLFKKALPVWKAQVLEARVKALEKRGGMDRETILRKASDQSNDFMGGQNTTLRNKDLKNQAQTFILAPDWAESQAKRGYKGYKAMFGKEDPIYRDAMLRSGAVRAVGGAIQAGSDSSDSEDPDDTQDWSDIGQHPGDLTTIGLGKTASGRFREAPLYGNASEGLRFPEEIIRAAAKGDLSAGAKVLGNRLSQFSQTGMNLLRSQDAFGNPMTGKDKYDRPIPMSTQLLNYIDEGFKPITPQPVQALISLARDKQGLEEAIAQSTEFPLKYSAPPKPARGSRGRKRSNVKHR